MKLTDMYKLMIGSQFIVDERFLHHSVDDICEIVNQRVDQFGNLICVYININKSNKFYTINENSPFIENISPFRRNENIEYLLNEYVYV